MLVKQFNKHVKQINLLDKYRYTINGKSLYLLDSVSQFFFSRVFIQKSWLRRVVIGALILGIFYAQITVAENGRLGSTSTATSHITLQILPTAQAQSSGELKLLSTDLYAIESGFCTSHLGVDLYRVKLSGLDTKDHFFIFNQSFQSLPISVSYKHQRGQFQSLKPDQLSSLYANNINVQDCRDAFLNQLRVEFPERLLKEKSNESYNSVLTLTLSAE